MIRWAIFSTLASGILYGCYCLLLRRDRWLMVSRSMLVCSLLFSLLLPLLRIPDLSHWPLTDSPLYTTMYLAPANIMPSDGATEPASNNISAFLPAVLYLAGVALMLAMLATDIVRTVLKLYKLPVRRHGCLRLHLIDDNSEPCSFFNHIVIGTRAMSRNEILCILAHEGAHLRMWHSWDVLAMRLMCCASWFNPFSWLMLNELRAVHEYQADEAALGSCSRKAYIGLLYRQATGFGYGHITNNFQSINLKKRIVMMNKTKSRFGAWKALAALPIAALLLMAGCQPANGESVEQEEIPFEATNVDESAPLDANTDEVFKVVEVDPEFPGGEEALYKYLAENIKYPVMAKNNKVEGRVYITFVIDKDGTVSDAKVLRSVNEELDAEALRVINAMPKWKPGMQRGVPVRVQYNIPISFKLQ